ncbi:VWA domain-containing protein [Candidatus Woesearchaeota archaeon]|nr:VWA domain-containing protein [Candidatus Woesearchaeota archaeon]
MKPQSVVPIILVLAIAGVFFYLDFFYELPENYQCEGGACAADEAYSVSSLVDPSEFVAIDLSIVLDRSRSMAGDRIANAKAAMKKLVGIMGANDRAALVAFNERASVVRGFTASERLLADDIDALTVDGTTQYIPALRTTLAGIIADPREATRELVIFVTDGQPDDEGRPDSILAETDTVTKAGVCIHTIGYGDAITPGSEAELILQRMARTSQTNTGCGGYHYAPDSEETLTEVFEDIYSKVLREEASKLTIILLAPEQKEYPTRTVPVEILTSQKADCTVTLNNQLTQAVFQPSFTIEAEIGENLLEVACQQAGIQKVRRTTFNVSRLGMYEDYLSFIQKVNVFGFFQGREVRLSDDDVESLFVRVLDLQNISGSDKRLALDAIMGQEELAEDALTIKQQVKTDGGRTEVKNKVMIEREVGVLKVYVDIPKCFADKLNEIVFRNSNYEVISDDPLIMWQFENVVEDIDLSYEIWKEIERECADEIRIVSTVEDVGRTLSGFVLMHFLPLLIIPIALFLVFMTKVISIEDVVSFRAIKKSEKRNQLLRILLVSALFCALIFLMYPKEHTTLLETCECFGLEMGGRCVGVPYSCVETAAETLNPEGTVLCRQEDCRQIANFIRLKEGTLLGESIRNSVDIVLIFDRSRSMMGDRFARAKEASKKLISLMSGDDRAAVILLNHMARLAQGFTDDQATLLRTIDGIVLDGMTQYIPSLSVAHDLILKERQEENKNLIIFVTDGQPDDVGRPASIINKTAEVVLDGICIHTIGYGDAITPGSEGEAVLKAMALTSRAETGCGGYHYAPDSEETLTEVFQDIYQEVTYRDELRIRTNIEDVIMAEGEFSINMSVASEYNDLSTPFFTDDDMLCIPPAKVTAYLIDTQYGDVMTLDVPYTPAGYSRRIANINPGTYEVEIVAEAATSSGASCNISGYARTVFDVYSDYAFDRCTETDCRPIEQQLIAERTERRTVLVNITPNGFLPKNVQIEEETTVVWTNGDIVSHSVVSGEGTPDGRFDSGLILPGGSFTHAFNETGNFTYYDGISAEALQAGVSYQEKEIAFSNYSKVDLTLVIDRSGSMSGAKLASAKDASKRFVDMLFEGDRAAIVEFGDTAKIIGQFTDNKVALRDTIGSIVSSESTAYLPVLETVGENYASQYYNRTHAKLVIFLSDGEPWDSSDRDIISKVRELVDSGICLYTIGYGDAVKRGTVAERLLQDMAEISKRSRECGEYYFSIQDSSTLTRILGEIYQKATQFGGLRIDAVLNGEAFGENETIIVRAGITSNYNNRPVPDASPGICIPPAHMIGTLKRGPATVDTFIIPYQKGRNYTTYFSDLAPGSYTLLINATSQSSSGQRCSLQGTESLSFTVEREGDSLELVIVYLWLLIMIAGMIWFLLHFIIKAERERKRQEREFYESM